MLGLVISFIKLSNTEHFKENFHIGKNKKKEGLNYKKAFKLVKWDAIGLFSSYFCAYIVLPGVFFSAIVT